MPTLKDSIGKRPSIVDVAREAGVSVYTVSRILHGGKSKVSFSEATRHKVLAASQALKYVPSYHARHLRHQHTRNAGLVLRNPDTPVTSKLIDAFATRFSEMEVHLMLEVLKDENGGGAREIVRELTSGMVDAVFISPPAPARELVSATGCPVIFLGNKPAGPQPYIVFGRREAARQGTRHLLDIGCRRVGHVGVAGDERHEGFCDALRERGIAPPLDAVVLGSTFTVEFGEQAGRQIAQSRNPPDGLFVASDLLAMGVMAGLAKGGKRVPEDVAVVGYDGIKLGAYLRPALTTMAVPYEQCAEHAAAMLKAIYEGKTIQDLLAMSTTLQASLVIRDSCGRQVNEREHRSAATAIV